MAFVSCTQDLEKYSTEECHLNFLYYYAGTGEVYNSEAVAKYFATVFTDYSFAYYGDAQRDTLWFEVSSMGFLSDVDRPIALKQVQVSDTVENARPGVHYVPFDDPSLAGLYRMPAGQDTVSIPVVLLRDPSLDDRLVVLRFTFADNGFFSPCYESMSTRTIFFTSGLIRPSSWIDGIYGKWGPVKHQLLMDWTNEPWDEDYISKLNDDSSYYNYLLAKLHKRLEEENAKRLADPKIGDVWREADGTEVKIP